MATFTLSGLVIQYDIDDNPISIDPITLELSYPNSTAALSYRILSQGFGEPPLVELTSNHPISAELGGVPVNPDSDLFIGQASTSTDSYVFMTFYDPLTGRDAMFQLGGTPLDLNQSPLALWTFYKSIISVGPATGAYGPGAAIRLADVPNVEIDTGPVAPTINDIFGTPGDDHLVGTLGDDRIYTRDSGPLGDLVDGSGGNDTISAATMSERTGMLHLNYSPLDGPVAVTLDGVANSGMVVKQNGTDTLVDFARPMLAGYYTGGLSFGGTSGNDRFTLNVGATQWVALIGDAGTDTFVLNGTGRVRLDFSTGNGVHVNLASRRIVNDGHGNAENIGGSNTNLEIVGSIGNDTIIGSAVAESYRYIGGNNTIDMGGGMDRVRYDSGLVASVVADLAAGTANVKLSTGMGGSDILRNVEWLRGARGNDRLTGDAGANILEGRAGNDSLYGGAGNDSLYGEEGNDFIGGGDGNDRILGGTGNDTLYGGAGNDTLYGEDGNDVLYGAAGRNQLYGGAGNDMLQAANLGDRLLGGTGNDTLRGGAGRDTLRGEDGDDVIHGGAGDDDLAGGTGNDLIYGTAGNNIIYAGLGNDTVQGGTGNDTIYGGSGRSSLYGNNGDDVIYASSSGDLVGGGAGNDSLYGGVGHDTIYAGLGNDFIGGGAGNDLIYGGIGANRIYGGVGNDTIVAGTGRDVMTGSPGADHFVFQSAAHIGIGVARDSVTDFVSGQDKINLQALKTAFNGTAGLTGKGASFYHAVSSGLLIGDQNGDKVADWVLALDNKPGALLVSDFLL